MSMMDFLEQAQRDVTRKQAKKHGNAVGDFLKNTRKSLKIKSGTVASAIDISYPFYSNIENGHKRVPLYKCDAIIEFFNAHGVDIKQLKPMVYLQHQAFSIEHMSDDMKNLFIKLADLDLDQTTIDKILTIARGGIDE